MLSLFPVKTKSKLLLLSLRVAVCLCFSNQRYLKFCGLPTLQYGLYSIATSESETAKFQISLARVYFAFILLLAKAKIGIMVNASIHNIIMKRFFNTK